MHVLFKLKRGANLFFSSSSFRNQSKFNVVAGSLFLGSLILLQQSQCENQVAENIEMIDSVKKKERWFDENYDRIDEAGNKWLLGKGGDGIIKTLDIEGGMTKTQVYRSKDRKRLAYTITLGNKLSGHPKILHGGITALIFDNAFGWGVYLLPKDPLGFMYVTAHLGVDYKNPGDLDNRRYVVLVDIDRVEKEKKIFVKGEMFNVDTGKVIAQADGLFIALKTDDPKPNTNLRNILDCIEKDVNPKDESLKCSLTI